MWGLEQFYLRILDDAVKNTFLSMNSWVHIFLIFDMTKWEVYIKPFWCILNYDDGLKEKPMWNCLNGNMHWPAFSWNNIFTWKNGWQSYHSYSNLGTGRHFIKNEWSKIVTSSETYNSIHCQWWNMSFQLKFQILEIFDTPLWV